MKIQSLSIAVPAKCGNNCKFCVAHISGGKYTNQIENNIRFHDVYFKDYIDKMNFARNNGCTSLILTGDGEPLLNRNFLKEFSHCNKQMINPFEQVELQTSGMLLDDEYLRFLRNTVGVKVISLSVSSLDSLKNKEYNQPKSEKFEVDIDRLCSEIKRYDFTLRLSLNLTDSFEDMTPKDILNRCEELSANQIIFRKLYSSDKNTEQDKWIDTHKLDENKLNDIVQYVKQNGIALNKLPYGAIRYAIQDMSTVIDTDCMNQELSDDLKYIILREDCKLYSHWEHKGSIIF